LTGLPNRTSLHEKCAACISESRQQRWPLGLLLVKVGQFQEINDTLGHREGDALVREVSLRLSQFTGPNEFIARIGRHSVPADPLSGAVGIRNPAPQTRP